MLFRRRSPRPEDPPLEAVPLLWVVLAQGAVLAPHALHLPFWMPLLWLALAAWRWRSQGRKPWGWKARLALVAVVSAGVLFHYHTLFGRNGGVALLAGMMTLKLMELHHRRDGLVAIYLGYFLVVTNFLYSQAPPMALYMLAVVLLLTAAMSILHHPPRQPLALGRLKLAGVMLLQALPMMVVLFVLFPRLPGPLWGMPEDSAAGLTGLGEEMSPGEIGSLSRSAAVAFRVAFDGPPPPPELSYWRGPVLWHFDGRRWTAGEGGRLSAGELELLGEPLRYRVTLEPHNRRWLFALDAPGRVPEKARLSGDYQLLADHQQRELRRYEMSSYLEYRMDAGPQPEAVTRAALQLPPAGNPQARELAARWREEAGAAGAGGVEGLVNRALGLFREEPFAYTLTPPLLSGDTVDQFLFETRRGFCEHYAGAFVFLMRAAGVPARVVTGYQGGEINPLGEYLIVRQSNAHAWAEVWLAGEGWRRVDPTAAVSPARVELGLDAALPAGEPVPLLARRDGGWVRDLGLRWDALNNFWNQWVLGYSADTQRKLLSRIAPMLASAQEMVAALVVAMSVLMALVAAWLFLPGRGSRDPVVRAWRRFCRRLARRGVVVAAGEGPSDFAARAAAALPRQSLEIRAIARLYVALRYRDTPRFSAGLAELRRRVRRFRP